MSEDNQKRSASVLPGQMIAPNKGHSLFVLHRIKGGRK